MESHVLQIRINAGGIHSHALHSEEGRTRGTLGCVRLLGLALKHRPAIHLSNSGAERLGIEHLLPLGLCSFPLQQLCRCQLGTALLQDTAGM